MAESITNGVIGNVPFDCSGTIGEWEDGWEFDKLELIQGVAVGWEKVSQIGDISHVKFGPSGKEPEG